MTNLQDATRLIAELTSKLAQLDDKVAAYRLDMAAEFTRHSEELLRSVPEDVAYRVSRAIADQLANYPSLYPPGSLSSSRSATPTNLEDIPWRGKGSPPPIPPQSSGSPKEPDPIPDPSHQRGPHDREQEFHGLFTPTYLPLLESFDRPQHSPHQEPISPGTTAIADGQPPDRQSPIASAQGSDSPHRHRRRPSPLRRATDTSIDSFASDSSGAKVRKSALRRSSGSSKADSPREHTPRRVRFEFQGQEVLPSSSPQSSATTLDKSDDAREKSALANDPYTTSLGDVQGEEDLPGERPRKVSSTQALRALSKAPLDDGTVWTVVNSGTEPEGSSDADKNRKLASPSPLSRANPEEDEMTLKKFTPGKGVCRQAGDDARDTRINGEVETWTEQEDSEEELFMTSKRGPKNKTSFRTTAKPSSPVPIETQLSQARRPVSLANTGQLQVAEKAFDSRTQNEDSTVKEDPIKQSRKSTDYEDDEEDFFEFDDDNEKSDYVAKVESSPPKKYLPEPQEEEEDEEEGQREDKKPIRVTATIKSHVDDGPSSPPINIPIGPRQVESISSQAPPKPEGVRAPSTSIGSFIDRDGRKRSLTPGPIKNTELLKELEDLDVEAPFFVGSVNGNSGVDASNVKSYQASLLSPTQTSGSFAERLMWERAQGFTYDSDHEDAKRGKADVSDGNGRR